MELHGIPDFPWGKGPEFKLPEPKPNICPYAQRFQEWAASLCAGVEEARSIVAVNQAKILLTDKYFAWRNAVPRNHRDRLGTKGHICIYRIFVDAYDRLMVVEISLTPPMLFLPPTPPPVAPPPPPLQIAGIFMGDKE